LKIEDPASEPRLTHRCGFAIFTALYNSLREKKKLLWNHAEMNDVQNYLEFTVIKAQIYRKQS
jgi:hypothetical protein